MERLKKRYELLQTSLKTLNDVLVKLQSVSLHDLYYTELRDSTIQRFEYSIDTFWKFMKAYLERQYGITTVASPKQVIKACVDVELITKEQYPLFIRMIDDRNLTSHAYNEELAQTIFEAIPTYFEHLNRFINKHINL